jgi:hypothetical protein
MNNESKSPKSKSDSRQLGWTISFLSLLNWIKKKTETIKLLKSKYPNEPWKWRDDWSKGYAEPNEKNWNKVLLFFGMVWTVLMSPVVIKLSAIKTIKDPRLFALIFPLVGVLFIFTAIKKILKSKSLGPAHLNFNDYGVIGGKLNGLIELSQQYPENTPVLIRLNNKKTCNSGSGENSVRTVSILWQKELHTTTRFNNRKTQIGIDFDIPFDTIPTFGEASNFESSLQFNTYRQYGVTDRSKQFEEFHWDLTIEISKDNSMQKLTYDIPIFKNSLSDSSKIQALEIREVEKINHDFKPTEYKINPIQDGIEIVFSKEKVKKTAITFSIVGLFFLAAGLFAGFLTFSASKFLFLISLLVPLAFVGVGSLFMFMGLLMAYQQIKIELTSSQLIVYRNFLGIKTEIKLGLNQILGVSLKSGMQQGDNIWYDIILNCDRKFPHTISAAIRNKENALWVVHQIEQRRLVKASYRAERLGGPRRSRPEALKR